MWSPNAADAVTLFDGNDFMSLGYNGHLEGYLVTYSAPLSDAVMMRWSERTESELRWVEVEIAKR